MEQIVRQAYTQKNWDLLVSILLNKNQMIEIQYVLGLEDFRNFASACQLIDLQKHQGFEIFSNDLHYFVTGGLMIKKNDKPKQSTGKRGGIRKQAIILDNNKSIMGFTQTISKGYVTKIQQFLLGQQKNIGYFYCNQDINLVLKININKLKSEIVQKLRSHINEKIKFINRLQIFSDIPRYIIQQSLQSFRFYKINFNELIYSGSLRSEFIYLLMKGQVMLYSNKDTKQIILRSPNIMAYHKLDQLEEARCLTQYCICIQIKRTNLQEILKKKVLLDEKQQMNAPIGNIMLRTQYLKKLRQVSHNNCNFQKNKGEQAQKNENSQKCLIRFKRQRYHKIQSIDCQKKLRIKQHFSNYLSQKYDQYSQKLPKNTQQNNQNPIIYQIKPMLPSIPSYQQIQNKLKQIRLKKINQMKQVIQQKSSKSFIITQLHSEKNDGENNRKIQNDCINAKIMRNLNGKIHRQMAKKYGTKIKIL